MPPAEAQRAFVTQETFLGILTLRLIVVPQKLEANKASITATTYMRCIQPGMRLTLVFVQLILAMTTLLAQFAAVFGFGYAAVLS